MTNKRKILGACKTYHFDQSVKSDKMHQNENAEFIKNGFERAEVLNNSFSNIVRNLKIPEYEDLNSVLKYKKHSSIIAIKEK